MNKPNKSASRVISVIAGATLLLAGAVPVEAQTHPTLHTEPVKIPEVSTDSSSDVTIGGESYHTNVISNDGRTLEIQFQNDDNEGSISLTPNDFMPGTFIEEGTASYKARIVNTKDALEPEAYDRLLSNVSDYNGNPLKPENIKKSLFVGQFGPNGEINSVAVVVLDQGDGTLTPTYSTSMGPRAGQGGYGDTTPVSGALDQ